MKTKELDNPYKEEFLEIKGRCKSRAKKNFWGGLAIVLLTILFMIVVIIQNKGIPHLKERQLTSFNYIIYIAVLVFLVGLWALNNYRFLKNVDGLDTPDHLLYWHEKKNLNERKLGFLIRSATLFYLFVSPFFFDPSLDPLICSLMAFIVIAIFAFLMYKYKEDKTYYDSRPDKEITEQLQKLIEQM